ncbi:MAG TPA: hypothetical protein VGK50_00495 [Coriobacteriia bacterium]|jgi:hypothetical protein
MRIRRFLPLAYAAVLAAGYALVFVVPWHVAAGAPAESSSYAVGFSNRASVAGVLLTAAALFALGIAGRKGADGRSFVREHPCSRGEAVPWQLVAVALLVAVTSAVFFAWIAYGTWTYGEKNYFLDRMAYVLNGNVPYRDMEFTYGPLLAYLPAAAWRALAPLGVSPVAAYEAVYVVLFASGVPLLAYAANRLGLARGQRAALFASTWAATAFNETVGINGLLVRFLLPVAAVLFFHARASKALERHGGPAALALGGWSFAAAAVCFAMSPEVGIACFLGLGVYLGWTARARRRREALWAFGGLMLAPALAVLAFGPAVFTHLRGMAGGALNFPVVPSPSVLVLLAALFGGAALLPRFLSADRPGAPALLALAVAGAVMLAGALGRADTSHVFFYGLVTVFGAAPLLAAARPRAFAAWVVLFALVFTLAHWLVIRYDYGAPIVDAAGRTPGISRRVSGRIALTVGLTRARGWTAWERGRAKPVSTEVDAFAAYRPLAAPLGFVDGTGLELGRRGWLASPYFRGVPFTPEQLATMEQHLEGAGYIMVEKSTAASLAQAATAQPARRVPGGSYAAYLMWPETFAERDSPPDLGRELRAYLAARYRVVTLIGPYAVLERKE